MGSVVHEMTDEEIKKQIEANRSELRELRFTFAVARSLQDPARVRKLKRDTARMLTVQRLRELGKAKVAPKTDRKKKEKKDKK